LVNMVYLECNYLNPRTFEVSSSLQKKFSNHKEFQEFYASMKNDPCVIVKVMYYDPNAFENLKHQYDIKLLSLKKDNPV
jgi:hypothetical protein